MTLMWQNMHKLKNTFPRILNSKMNSPNGHLLQLSHVCDCGLGFCQIGVHLFFKQNLQTSGNIAAALNGFQLLEPALGCKHIS